MTLSDARIRRRLERGDLKIDGLQFHPNNAKSFWGRWLQPASVDVRLDRHFAVMKRTASHGVGKVVIDPKKDNSHLFERVTLNAGKGLEVPPGRCVLASTYERFTLPNDLIGHVHGKSSIGRLFMQVHCTAGLLDPGWDGYVTLELTNLSPHTWLLRPGMKIAQVTFSKTRDVARPYGSKHLRSHYQGQERGPVLPRGHENFTCGLPDDKPTWTAGSVLNGQSFTIRNAMPLRFDLTDLDIRPYPGPVTVR